MASTTEFYNDPDWHGLGPVLSHRLASGDLWPHGADSESDGAGDKDELEDGVHPVLAIGAKAVRAATTPVGIVMTYNPTVGLAEVNVAKGVVVRQYVANILTYNAGAAATWDNSLVVGDPVYVDDSPDLPAGVTLSRSPLNAAGDNNPLAGWIFYGPADYQDSQIGGEHTAAGYPKAANGAATESVLCHVLLKGLS